MLDLLTVFLGTSALSRISLKCNYDLMNQILVVLTSKHGLRRVKFRSCLTLVIKEFKLHQLAPFVASFCTFTLTAGRTVTKPPGEPGTAPLINNN